MYNILSNVMNSKTSFLQDTRYGKIGSRIEDKGGILDKARAK